MVQNLTKILSLCLGCNCSECALIHFVYLLNYVTEVETEVETEA